MQRVLDEGTSRIHYLGARAPALPRGQRRIAVELTFRSTGKAPYDDSPEDELSLIGASFHRCRRQGAPGNHRPGPMRVRPLDER